MSTLKEFFQARLMELGKNIDKYKIINTKDYNYQKIPCQEHVAIYIDQIYITKDAVVISELKKLYFEIADLMLEKEFYGTLNYLEENIMKRLNIIKTVFKLERDDDYSTTLNIGIGEYEESFSFLLNKDDEINEKIGEINSSVHEVANITYTIISKYMKLNKMVQELRKIVRMKYQSMCDADKMSVTENLIKSRSCNGRELLITDMELNILEVNDVFSRVRIDENDKGICCMIRDKDLVPLKKMRIKRNALKEMFNKRIVNPELLKIPGESW